MHRDRLMPLIALTVQAVRQPVSVHNQPIPVRADINPSRGSGIHAATLAATRPRG